MRSHRRQRGRGVNRRPTTRSLGFPRGGVAIGFEIAQALGAPRSTSGAVDGSVLTLRDPAQFDGLRVCFEQRREALGIAARHAAFGGHAVDPDMAPGGSEASGVAGHAR